MDARSAHLDSAKSASADGPVDASAAEAAALKARLSRKRTKTGCLTCRKRRIKCGEERPTCKNCVKSKRHCEGYSQRVVFKPPTVDFRHLQNGAATITFQGGALGGPADAQSAAAAYADPNMMYSSQLRPRPLMPLGQDGQPLDYAAFFPGQQIPVAQMPAMFRQMQHPSFGPQGAVWGNDAQGPMISPGGTLPIPYQHLQYPQYSQGQSVVTPDGAVQQIYGYPALDANTPWATAATHQYSVAPGHPSFQAWPHSEQTSQAPFGGFVQGEQQVPNTPLSSQQTPPSSVGTHHPLTQPPPDHALWHDVAFQPQSARKARPGPSHSSSHSEAHEGQRTSFSNSSMGGHDQSFYDPTDIYQQPVVQDASPGRVLNEAAIEVFDDDFYDVDPELDDHHSAMTHAPGSDSELYGTAYKQTLSRMQSLLTATGLRDYDLYMDRGVIDSYRPERVANPLKNEMTARVFSHFIAVTGPTISTFTRRARNSKMTVADGVVPFSQQGIWTYSMPMAALHNQGLLQAILSISSLHIAKITGASTTPSIKHYAYALKRIHQSLSSPNHRRSVPVIAATLLLGYYELWSADHMKWNSHLSGARQLFTETEFASMTRRLRKMKLEASNRQFHAQREAAMAQQAGVMLTLPTQSAMDVRLSQVPEMDAHVVSSLVGRYVNYDDYGRIVGPESSPDEGPVDVPNYELLRDLFWWYCKQDVYQSMVSGNPLLLSFNSFTDCPPRAPMNQADAVYGSFDHIILLLARICDFVVRDRPRKAKAFKAKMAKRQAAAQGGPGGPGGGPPPQLPAFYGMAPSSGRTHMPSSYGPHTANVPEEATPEPQDLVEAERRAQEEWGQIRGALHNFQSMLGPRFQPLGADLHQPLVTPFGQAIFYRSYDISCLWIAYNMAVIFCLRARPDMPPHTYVAIGMAAKETRHYAAEMARVAAGLIPPPADEILNPTLSAAFCESCLPLFFAGVQMVESAQRDWIVDRLSEIERRCGYPTAGIIASGCKTAWHKASMRGQGPRYVRQWDSKAEDARLNGVWEQPGAPDEENPADRRNIQSRPAARLHWAVGIMGTEDDA